MAKKAPRVCIMENISSGAAMCGSRPCISAARAMLAMPVPKQRSEVHHVEHDGKKCWRRGFDDASSSSAPGMLACAGLWSFVVLSPPSRACVMSE